MAIAVTQCVRIPLPRTLPLEFFDDRIAVAANRKGLELLCRSYKSVALVGHTNQGAAQVNILSRPPHAARGPRRRENPWRPTTP
jgi:hypothetical protein